MIRMKPKPITLAPEIIAKCGGPNPSQNLRPWREGVSGGSEECATA